SHLLIKLSNPVLKVDFPALVAPRVLEGEEDPLVEEVAEEQDDILLLYKIRYKSPQAFNARGQNLFSFAIYLVCDSKYYSLLNFLRIQLVLVPSFLKISSRLSLHILLDRLQ